MDSSNNTSNDAKGLPSFVEIGKKYPISLGDVGSLVTMQYLFKPVSVNDQAGGKLSGSYNSNNVNLDLTSLEDVTEKFIGVKRSSANDHEYLLIQEGNSFKLQKIAETVLNLRLQRKENVILEKESSNKQSKQLVESMKIPKLKQKNPPKKKAAVKTKKTTSITSTTTNDSNLNVSQDPKIDNVDPKKIEVDKTLSAAP